MLTGGRSKKLTRRQHSKTFAEFAVSATRASNVDIVHSSDSKYSLFGIVGTYSLLQRWLITDFAGVSWCAREPHTLAIIVRIAGDVRGHNTSTAALSETVHTDARSQGWPFHVAYIHDSTAINVTPSSLSSHGESKRILWMPITRVIKSNYAYVSLTKLIFSILSL